MILVLEGACSEQPIPKPLARRTHRRGGGEQERGRGEGGKGKINKNKPPASSSLQIIWSRDVL